MKSLDETWRKSSYSGTEGACVEVRRTAETVQVRDAKQRTRATLEFTSDSWNTFVSGVLVGEFDRR